jgi:UPF0716 family protein affecting phage T7 exclusion
LLALFIFIAILTVLLVVMYIAYGTQVGLVITFSALGVLLVGGLSLYGYEQIQASKKTDLFVDSGKMTLDPKLLISRD